VGYGKTELAMRAAFKSVDFGKQVAVLVPTTVLAEQHYRTFSQRMAEYPFRIEVLSRFKTRAEQRAILDDVAAGKVDLVIGTHRLLQSDVRFHDLGLVVIDEEQRFGVEHKNRLRAMRTIVDVLTLTATPIPRTLHLALLGARDISNLETPPQDRLSIETRVSRFDSTLVRHAIVRELNRDGQVYFVHNRVHSIKLIAGEIQSLVPEARIAIVHGQMPEAALDRAMTDFVNHKSDVLVATTIIESGLDIPNANTILIHQADRYGLADLHQLRGRVGRYKRRAYCYLLLDDRRPVAPGAVKRLKAIEEYSQLGAGFKIALRDLEIRGAGNILGTAQSGHITAVGYELYCQLLENAVRRMRNQPLKSVFEVAIDLPWRAYLPRDYVPTVRDRIDLYRRLGRVESLEGVQDLRAEFGDRFGPPPPTVANLFEMAELRILARRWQIDAIHLEDRYVVLGYRDRDCVGRLVAKSQRALRVADARTAYLQINKGDRVDGLVAASLKLLLQPD
jgi:transcription-repair coupling factor (superfamily II helicase)